MELTRPGAKGRERMPVIGWLAMGNGVHRPILGMADDGMAVPLGSSVTVHGFHLEPERTPWCLPTCAEDTPGVAMPPAPITEDTPRVYPGSKRGEAGAPYCWCGSATVEAPHPYALECPSTGPVMPA
jgi:hypothetical protein